MNMKNSKKKKTTKNSSSGSSNNSQQYSDENRNSSNNSSRNNNISKLSDNSETKKTIQNLRYIFPFLKESLQQNSQKGKDDFDMNRINNYTKSEYNKIVTSINDDEKKIETNKSTKNQINEQMLEGKINIIDKVIQKHIPNISNDSKIITINQGMTTLCLKIDRFFNMMNDIGYRLPNLIELDLKGSEIDSIMDIGTSFYKLEKLNVSNCGLIDLSGIICFKKLKELYAANNKISDLIDIEMCDELKLIDLSNNLIIDEDNLLFLYSCPKLEKVILTGNKLEIHKKNLINNNIQIVI